MFLFSKQHEELVGIYASQLARHRCIELFVHMMELRMHSRYFYVNYRLLDDKYRRIVFHIALCDPLNFVDKHPLHIGIWHKVISLTFFLLLCK